MKILMINVVCGIRSTGRICADLATALEAQGHEVRIAYGRGIVPEQFRKYAIRVGTDFDNKMHGFRARLVDGCGFGSKSATENLIEWIKEYNPDVIHLHNIHGYYVNIEILFDYLRTCGKRVIWTLHDCWAFTVHAAYCEAAGCERWKEGCYNCPKKFDYPKSLVDNSKNNWVRKKEILTSVQDLHIVTPSQWLANLVKHSYLSENKVSVIHNGVDTSVFRPVNSNIKKDLGIEGKKVILGVAALWEQRKGLYDFYRLSRELDDKFRIVLVGLSKKQMKKLPTGIIGIERTNSTKELASLYSASEVYFNPTYEDNYPTTNLEAIACGTPVITYDTGGSGESAKLFGAVVNKGDIERVYQIIVRGHFVKKESDMGIKKMVNKYIRIIENGGGITRVYYISLSAVNSNEIDRRYAA